MLLFSALVAGSFSLGTRIANAVDPAALTTLRFALAMLLIGAVTAATTGFRRTDFRAPWRDPVPGGLFACYFVLMFEGLKTVPTVSANAVLTLTPLLMAYQVHTF